MKQTHFETECLLGPSIFKRKFTGRKRGLKKSCIYYAENLLFNFYRFSFRQRSRLKGKIPLHGVTVSHNKNRGNNFGYGWPDVQVFNEKFEQDIIQENSSCHGHHISQ
jgi:hypothetical protein